MKSIGATELRRRCFEILPNLPPEGLLITKRGRVVAIATPTPANLAARRQRKKAAPKKSATAAQRKRR